jgi:hypothetical protein
VTVTAAGSYELVGTFDDQVSIAEPVPLSFRLADLLA